jgi:hypothetical protein
MYAAILLFIVHYCLAIPFPTVPIDNTIYLQHGKTYQVDSPIVWTDYKRLIISGAGATVQINESLINQTVFSMVGEKWIWEAVNIKGSSMEHILNMSVSTERGFLQIRGCYWSTSAQNDITVTGSLDLFVLQNNLFQNKGFSAPFFDIDSSIGRLIWTNNQWQGNYSMYSALPAEKMEVERNRWPKGTTHASFFDAGPFYHPEDDLWCLPPGLYSSLDQPYVACLNSWFLKAFDLQTQGNNSFKEITYHPVQDIIDDQDLPSLWTFTGRHEIDFDGYSWNPASLTTFVNSSIILKGLEAGWDRQHMNILVMHNSTLELRDLALQGPDMVIDIAVLTSSSHIFFDTCHLSGTNMIGTGLGHVHVQDSKLQDFLLSAPTIWGSENVLVNGKIITQPYTGHLQYSRLQNTDYHVSPFYLGTEPLYRVKFIRNIWEGTSDIVLSSTLSGAVQIDEDVIESAKLARKVAFSSKIIANGLRDRESRPLLASAPSGHIWPSGATPTRCPDGTTPGVRDDMYVPTKCVPCTRPEKSKDGVCDNVRSIDLIPETPPMGRLGSTIQSAGYYSPDTSYYRFIAGDKIRSDCYTCTALCLGLQPDQLNTTQFTLIELLEPGNHTTYCSKCALYCADVSGCASYCLTFEAFFIGLVVALLCIGLPFFCFASICLRARTVKVKINNLIGNKHCESCGVPIHKNDNFCHECGTPHKHALEEPKQPRNRDVKMQDLPSMQELQNIATIFAQNK